MANTKNLSPAERKKAKRAARAALKKLHTSLTRKQRAEMKKSGKGIKQYLASLEKPAS